MPSVFQESYSKGLSKDIFSIYTNHDLSFLYAEKDLEIQQLETQFESVLKAQLLAVKKEYEINLREM